jgi:hypothetical protein
MALPASGPLSLNDIRVELQQAQANSSLGALSDIAGFAAPDAVSDFYGYSYANYNTVSIVNAPEGSSAAACAISEEDDLTLYFAGSGGAPACPALSTTLYTNTGLTTPYNGDGQWFKSQQCSASYYIESNGFIEGNSDC